MQNTELEKLKYPIGKPKFTPNNSKEAIDEWIDVLEKFPDRLSNLVNNLSEKQLNTPYRPEGWTVRQLIHHIADSHHHSYTRFKWTLTESTPLIKAYEEKEWSKLFDANTAPISLSLTYISALHAKLVYLLKGLSANDLKKEYMHPEGNTLVSLEENIAKYAWHSNHHFEHINALIKREGW